MCALLDHLYLEASPKSSPQHTNPTTPFKTLEPQNTLMDDFLVVQERYSTDFNAPNCERARREVAAAKACEPNPDRTYHNFRASKLLIDEVGCNSETPNDRFRCRNIEKSSVPI